jgi:signal transduction histidine kinase
MDRMPGGRRSIVLAKAFSALTHDLNNALQAISSTAELMAARGELPSDVRRKAERIYLKAQDAASRLDLMSALARGGQAPPRRQNVGAVIAEALALRRRDLTHAKVTVSVPSPLPAVFTRAAPGSLELLVLHLLIETERAFTGAGGGTLTVSLDQAAEQILVAIAADRLVPVAVSETPESAGDVPGADLVEARRLAREMGAEVSVQQEAGGTRFELRLASAND